MLATYRPRPWLFALLLAVTLAPGFARSESPEITVLTREFYPLSFRDEADSGPAQGVATELVKAVLDEAGLSYQIRSLPWSRALQRHANAPNVLIYPIARTAERESRFHWVGAIVPLQISLYRLKSDTGINPTSIEEATAFRVGTLRGGMVREYLDRNGFSNLIEINSINQHLSMVDRDRYDLFPFVDYALDGVAMRENIDPGKFERVLSLPDLSPVLSISLSGQTDPELARRISDAYIAVQKSGRYSAIMESLIAPSRD